MIRPRPISLDGLDGRFRMLGKPARDDADATRSSQANAESLARESLEISKRQYQLGAVNYLTAAMQSEVISRRVSILWLLSPRGFDTCALFVALVWLWNRPNDDRCNYKRNSGNSSTM